MIQININKLLLDFQQLVLSYYKFYEYSGKYNFEHFLEELFKTTVLLYTTNNLYELANTVPDTNVDYLEYDDRDFNSIVSKLKFHIIQNSEVRSSGYYSTLVIDPIFYDTLDFQHIYVILSNNQVTTSSFTLGSTYFSNPTTCENVDIFVSLDK